MGLFELTFCLPTLTRASMKTMYNVYEGKEHPTKEQSLKEREERGEERRGG